MTTSVPNATDVLTEGIVKAVRDTMWFALGENSLKPTVSPIEVRETGDGWAVYGTFVLGDDEVHTFCKVGAFNKVEILPPSEWF